MKRIPVAFAVALATFACAAQAQTVEEKAKICATCHGGAGVPQQQPFAVPAIWGQQLGYLFFQLRDFKSGARKSEVMSPIAQALPHEDLTALAQYFSKMSWPKRQEPQSQPQPSADPPAQRGGAPAACASCHQEGFVGGGMQPRLAGQERAYLEKTMAEFQSGTRGNNPGMTDLMRSLTPQDISALAAWLAAM